MRKLNYFNINGVHVAAIGAAGSASFGRLSAGDRFQVLSIRQELSQPTNKLDHHPGLWHGQPKVVSPVRPLIPVRDPVERFISACRIERVADPAALLDQLESAFEIRLFRFHPTIDYLTSDCLPFRFPDHLKWVAAQLGVKKVPVVSPGPQDSALEEKIDSGVVERVNALYGADRALYDSIPKKLPAEGFDYGAYRQEEKSALEKLNEAFSALDLGVQALWSPVIESVRTALARNDIDRAHEILATVPSFYNGTSRDAKLLAESF